jgi:putative membrane protein
LCNQLPLGRLLLDVVPATMQWSLLLFWGLVIAAVVLLVRYVSGSHLLGTGRDAASAGQILAERFARGEIDEEEYQRRVDVLRPGGRNLAKQ